MRKFFVISLFALLLLSGYAFASEDIGQSEKIGVITVENIKAGKFAEIQITENIYSDGKATYGIVVVITKGKDTSLFIRETKTEEERNAVVEDFLKQIMEKRQSKERGGGM